LFDLTGNVAVVLGATGVLGGAIAEGLAVAGARVAVLGRNADSPLIVLAAASAGDCFEVAIEAVRLATKYMTPVILLTDGYLAHAAEPWLIPDVDALPGFPVTFRTDPEGFHPYVRDAKTLARAWAVPGTPGLAHRIGGLSGHHIGAISRHESLIVSG